jgi:hypothetical protein
VVRILVGGVSLRCTTSNAASSYCSLDSCDPNFSTLSMACFKHYLQDLITNNSLSEYGSDFDFILPNHHSMSYNIVGTADVIPLIYHVPQPDDFPARIDRQLSGG